MDTSFQKSQAACMWMLPRCLEKLLGHDMHHVGQSGGVGQQLFCRLLEELGRFLPFNSVDNCCASDVLTSLEASFKALIHETNSTSSLSRLRARITWSSSSFMLLCILDSSSINQWPHWPLTLDVQSQQISRCSSKLHWGWPRAESLKPSGNSQRQPRNVLAPCQLHPSCALPAHPASSSWLQVSLLMLLALLWPLLFSLVLLPSWHHLRHTSAWQSCWNRLRN